MNYSTVNCSILKQNIVVYHKKQCLTTNFMLITKGVKYRYIDMTWEIYHLVSQRSNKVIRGGNFQKFSELGGGTNAILNHTENIIEGGG